MAWTTSDLEALEKAIASGTTRVKYSDREVNYRTLDEMLKIRDMMAKELGDKPAGPYRALAQFSKGLGDA